MGTAQAVRIGKGDTHEQRHSQEHVGLAQSGPVAAAQGLWEESGVGTEGWGCRGWRGGWPGQSQRLKSSAFILQVASRPHRTCSEQNRIPPRLQEGGGVPSPGVPK